MDSVVVRLVQFTSASRCVDELGLCIIVCEVRGQGEDGSWTQRDATRYDVNELVTLSQLGLARVTRSGRSGFTWLFVRLLHQSGKRSGSG
jgi:hypothetical protein